MQNNILSNASSLLGPDIVKSTGLNEQGPLNALQKMDASKSFGDVLGTFIAPETAIMAGDTTTMGKMSSKDQQSIVNQMISQVLMPEQKDQLLTPSGASATLDPNKMLLAFAAKSLLNNVAAHQDGPLNNQGSVKTAPIVQHIQDMLAQAIPSKVQTKMDVSRMNDRSTILLKDDKKLVNSNMNDVKDLFILEEKEELLQKKELFDKILTQSDKQEHSNNSRNEGALIPLNTSISSLKETQNIMESAKTETVKYLTKSLESYMEQKYQPIVSFKNDSFTIKVDGSLMLDARMMRVEGQWQLQMDISGRNTDIFVQKSAMLHERLNQLGITGVFKKAKKEA